MSAALSVPFAAPLAGCRCVAMPSSFWPSSTRGSPGKRRLGLGSRSSPQKGVSPELAGVTCTLPPASHPFWRASGWREQLAVSVGDLERRLAEAEEGRAAAQSAALAAWDAPQRLQSQLAACRAEAASRCAWLESERDLLCEARDRAWEAAAQAARAQAAGQAHFEAEPRQRGSNEAVGEEEEATPCPSAGAPPLCSDFESADLQAELAALRMLLAAQTRRADAAEAKLGWHDRPPLQPLQPNVRLPLHGRG